MSESSSFGPRQSSPIALTPEALDFAPDLLAIQERPPARLPRALLISVSALLGLMLLWAFFAELDIIASAEGRLVPIGFTKVVQPAEAGVVSEILVKDGDRVRAGQLLMRLDSRLSKADNLALGKEVALKKLSLRRVEAELADRAFAPGNGEPADLYAQVESQFRARRQAYLDAMSQEGESLNKAKSDLLASQQILAKLTQTLPSYKQSAEAYRKLVQEGFVGELASNEKSREALEKEQDLKAQAANVQSLNIAIAQSERKLAAIRSQYRSQLENERIEILALLNRSGQELEKSNVKAELMEILAPNDGIVKDMTTTTRGAVVAAGTLLMNIVPQDEPLQAEVLLKNEDVGFVSLGQKAKVKVAAYPFQKYGMLNGRVEMVSADSADPKQPQPQSQGLPPLTYRALVRLDTRQLLSVASGERLELNPGMLVSAEIHQGKRSVLEYLLSPVRKVAQEAARER
ncbi:HlyD family type I secretion periplasmic adaptor subunit [Roseateles koreensis]|uniref:Membrane fusion protein (MFP) family protein n=1 Tax=Roseateles koreensis TaxID=2987526 RepID=A0ABT5KNP4_9BURK|nr:HlyD family type I secretion periplasmic adaptor subunit [Roseateles koreensis]MDC8784545.1 HlyD family type I secretion periplasmic adaptor subunit [Roseateles koreensis]